MSLVDLLLPPACAGCGAGGAVLCEECRRSLGSPSAVEDRFVRADAGVVIGEELVLGLAAFAYRGPLRRALAQLKYEGARRVGPELAAAAGPSLKALMRVVGAGALVPVPVHDSRRRQRGYDQADLLAQALGSAAGLTVRCPLRRVRQTEKQHRLNRAERLRNLRDAFVTVEPAPQVAVLVDDIITTTATLEACAAVLRASGAGTVYGFAIAREV